MTSLHEHEIQYVYTLKFKIGKVENYNASAGLGYNFKTTKLFPKIFT